MFLMFILFITFIMIILFIMIIMFIMFIILIMLIMFIIFFYVHNVYNAQNGHDVHYYPNVHPLSSSIMSQSTTLLQLQLVLLSSLRYHRWNDRVAPRSWLCLTDTGHAKKIIVCIWKSWKQINIFIVERKRGLNSFLL